MCAKDAESRSARRSFLARIGIGAGVIAATLASPVARAAHGSWRPARHTQDDWLDKIPGIHRVVFDTTTPDEMESALRYAQNFYLVNQDAYGLKDSDLAVVIIARHTSTPFGYNDAIWAKYGKELSQRIEFTDPKTKQPPTANTLATQSSGSLQSGRMADLIKRGAQFAVCEMASRELAGMIGLGIGVDADALAKEFGANLIGNARMVPAGIVAVNRAQERGYTLA
jgi:intracellular sulfur oxidation DsrE/DsrF family protein